ncbi:MAG: hypothetical protein ACTHQ3_14560 [Motilibacteraceae bacterium]
MGELDLITLGVVDVEPAVLHGPGVPLAEPPIPESVEDRIEPAVRAAPLVPGWR